MKNTSPKRAVGYCRTSGEGQRDNTSIPNQQEAIGRFCDREGFTFLAHYVDECKSGKKIAGRDNFQRLMKDAANEKFDVVVPYDISRWGRDTLGILNSTATLKNDFSVDVIDTEGKFDTRDDDKSFMNHISALFAGEDWRKIKGKLNKGRIDRARGGRPWTKSRPVGREFDAETGRWYITEKGKMIAEALRRYADGEPLKKVAEELGLSYRELPHWANKSQLSGTYHANFKSGESVPVPAIPEVIPDKLLEKVKARFKHNRTFNRNDAKKYRLSGFIYCPHCGAALTAATQFRTLSSGTYPYFYFVHPKNECSASKRCFRGEKLTEAVMDYLYAFFLDEPAFRKAVEAAMPSSEHRDELASQLKSAKKRLTGVKKEIANLVNAIAKGVNPNILLSKQDSLEAEKKRCEKKVEELEIKLAEFPSKEETQLSAELLRMELQQKYQTRDWHKLDHSDTKKFLHHLFSDNPKENNLGVFVDKTETGISVMLKGSLDFQKPLLSGKAYPLEALESEEMKKVQKAFRNMKKTQAEADKLEAIIEKVESAQNEVDKLTPKNKGKKAKKPVSKPCSSNVLGLITKKRSHTSETSQHCEG